MVKFVFHIATFVGQILQIAIFLVFAALVVVLFVPTFPILFFMELYCLMVSVTVLSMLNGKAFTRRRFGSRLLSLSGLCLVKDTLLALRDVILFIDVKDNERASSYKKYLGRSLGLGSDDYSYGYGGGSGTKFNYPLNYAIFAPLTAVFICAGLFLATYSAQASIKYAFCFGILTVTPVLYYLIVRRPRS